MPVPRGTGAAVAATAVVLWRCCVVVAYADGVWPLGENEVGDLLNLVPVAIIVRTFGVDTIVAWSRGAQELYGWAQGEALGKVTHDLLQTQFPGSKDAVDAELQAVGTWAGELVHTRRDGTRVVVASRQAVQRDAQGRPNLTLEINSDVTERKQASANLRESEQRFRLLVDGVKDYAIFLISPEGRVVTWNEGAQRLKGYTPEEIIGRSFTLFYTPEDREAGVPQRLLSEAAEHGRVEVEAWRVRKDGTRFWADVIITALRDDQDRLTGYAKVTRDLTERKEAEDARARASREEGARAAAEAHEAELRASRDQLAAILSGVAEGIMAQDRTGQIVYANDMAARLCGFPDARAFLQASVPEVVRRFEIFDEHGQPVPRQDLPAQRMLRGEPARETILRFRLTGAHEEDRWSVVQATPLRDASGRVEQVISIFRDFTERKRAEDTARFLAAVNLELTRSLDYEETLRRVADLAVPTLADWCAVDVIDDRGGLQRLGVAHVDPAKVRLAQELAARYPDTPSSTDGRWQVAKTQNPMLLGEITDDQIVAAARDAEHLAILRSLEMHSMIVVPLVARGQSLGTISLVAAESGRRYGPRELAVAEDLAVRAALAVDNARLYYEAQEQARVHVELNAALRSAMNQLEHSLRTRDEFLASAAHDLKNPLASMKGIAQLLQRRIRANDASIEPKLKGILEEALKRIDNVASRATSQVEELLDIARMQMGRPLDLDLNPTDVVQLAREAIAEQDTRSELHQLAVESELPSLIGLWDGRRLSRAIGNLLDNAIKYSPEGGPVRVRVEQQDGAALLSIEDHGVGIPAEDLERVFQRFERGTNVIGEISGTGIGLASARHIVESHGGSISATSAVGQGTTFVVRLPISEEP
jgi:PAS domain S-box-containing protein